MKARLLARVGQLERIKTREEEKPLRVQLGHLKRLPADYDGERYVVTVGRRAADEERPGWYDFEERPGIAPNESQRENILRVCFVSPAYREECVDQATNGHQQRLAGHNGKLQSRA
jgi:hypothetical protein